MVSEFIKEHVKDPDIKRAISLFATIHIILYTSLFTLWFLETQVPDVTTLIWAAFRVPDLLPLLLLGVVWVCIIGSVQRKTLPQVIFISAMIFVMICNVGNLVLFGFTYQGCQTFNNCMDNSDAPSSCNVSDPLCTVRGLPKIIIFYLCITTGFLLNNIAITVVIGTVLIYYTNVNIVSEKKGLIKMAPKINSTVRARYHQFAAMFMVIAWIIIAFEFFVLTDWSLMKLTLLSVLLYFPSIIQVISSYHSRFQNKRFAWFQLIATGISGLMTVISFIYAYLNCINVDSGTMFPMTQGCDLGNRGSYFLIGLNAVLTGIGGFKLIIYRYTIKRQGKTDDESGSETIRRRAEKELLKEIDMAGEARSENRLSPGMIALSEYYDKKQRVQSVQNQ